MKRSLLLFALGMLLLTACDELDPREPGLLVPLTVDQDSSLPSITVNGTLLHSESFGDSANPMVVVLHGGPGSDYRYLINCKVLASKGFYVVFYDQRGSGLSKRERKSSYSLQLMLDDLTAVIEHYRTSPAQKVILLGHSWGAMLATAYINQYPTAINGAILAEPGGFVWKDIKEYMSRAQKYDLNSEALNDATYVDQLLTGKPTEHEILDYKLGLAFSPDSSDKDPVGNEGHVPFWRMGAVVNEALLEIGDRDKPNWTGNLRSFTTQILFLYSERNTAYGLEYAQHVSSAYPNVDLKRIDNAGHDMLTFPHGWNHFLPIAVNYLNELEL
jgi:proline iminopeptidase